MLYALAVDENNGMVNRAEVRVALDRALVPVPAAVAAADTLAAWGTSAEAQQGQSAMMNLMG